MATDYDALVRQLGGNIESDAAGGMTTDAEGRPVLRVNVSPERTAPPAEKPDVPRGLPGADVEPVATVDIPPSDYAALAADLGGEVSDAPAPDADIYALPATFSKGIVKGVASLPDMLARGLGYGMGSAAELFGAPADIVESLKNPQTVGGALDYLQPTAPNQELVERTGEGVGGALSGVGIGQLLAKYGAPVTAAIGETLASQPALQSVAGGTSGLSSAVAEKAGYGDFGQFVAGLAGGIVPVAAFPSIKTALETLLSPLSSDSAKNGAAALLQRYSIDPARAVRSIQQQSALNTLPGVAPTTAEVAGDAGLASLQRVLGNTDVTAAAEMSNRMQANMAARARAISQAAGQGDPEALIAAATARQNALEAATRQAGERVGSLNPPDVSGEALRAQLAERAKEAKAAVREQYRAIPEDADPIQVGAIDVGVSAPPSGDGAVGRFTRNVQETLAERIPDAGAAGMRAQGGTLAGMLKSKVHPQSPLGRELTALGYGPKQRPDLYNNNANPRMELDKLVQSARERGFIEKAPEDAPDDYGANDFLSTLVDDLAATGRGAAGKRAMSVEGQLTQSEVQARQQNQDYISQILDERKLDPEKMRADDWDALYRDINDLPEQPVTAADIEFLSGGADVAEGRALLSPFQTSLMTLRRRFFPGAGLPEDKSVSNLIRQLENADVMSARQVERIAADLRRQSRLLKMSDARSGALASAAANATEGLLLSQAGPARAEALRGAGTAYRTFKTTFAENEPGRVLATDPFSRPTLDTSRVPGTVVPGNITGGTATRRLVAAAGPEAAEQAAREELRRALNAAGNNSDAISALMSPNRYGPVLAEYPGLMADVTKVRDAAALAEAFAESSLGRLRTAKVSPSESVAVAVRAKDDGRALRNMAGAVRNDQNAQAGLRRALVDFILPSDLKGGMTASGDVVAPPMRTLENLNTVLQKTSNTNLFTPEQNKVLGEVRRQLRALRFASTAARTSGSDTALNRNFLADQVARLVVEGVVPGAGRATRMLDFVIGAVADTGAVAALAREAMLDPALAASLLQRTSPDRLSKLASKLGAISRGATAATVVADQPEEEDMSGLSTMPGAPQ